MTEVENSLTLACFMSTFNPNPPSFLRNGGAENNPVSESATAVAEPRGKKRRDLSEFDLTAKITRMLGERPIEERDRIVGYINTFFKK